MRIPSPCDRFGAGGMLIPSEKKKFVEVEPPSYRRYSIEQRQMGMDKYKGDISNE